MFTGNPRRPERHRTQYEHARLAQPDEIGERIDRADATASASPSSAVVLMPPAWIVAESRRATDAPLSAFMMVMKRAGEARRVAVYARPAGAASGTPRRAGFPARGARRPSEALDGHARVSTPVRRDAIVGVVADRR